MIHRGIPYFFFCLLSLNIVLSQQTNTYLKPNLNLGLGWQEAELQAYIYKRFPVLSSTRSQLELSYEIESLGGKHFTYVQTYEGKAIHEAGVKVNVDHQGKVYSILVALKDFDTSSLDIEDKHIAEKEIRSTIAKLTHAYEVKTKSKWLIQEDQLIPVIQGISYSHEEVVSYEFLVDARSGEILEQEDQGAYAMPTDTSGRGRVFAPDPCTHAEANYGELFTDAADMHLPIFDSLLDTIELKGLTYENGLFKLIGPYVEIEDRAPFNVSPATSSTGDFFYTRDQSEFEDVMVYYHIDSFQRYIQSLGFTNLQNKPFKADPHGKSDLDQSVFVINGNDSYVLFGDGGVDDAEDADVIIHEYGHALSYAAAPDTRSGTERKGLDEGIGDYFASSYSQDLNNWGWYKVFIWDGHNEFWQGRTTVNTLSYPLPSGSNIYTYGELWAATMMQIRNDVGSEVADKLQLEAMYANFVGMTIPDAARAIVDADSMLYDGAHVETIRDYFCQRNILTDSCLPVSLSEENSSLILPEIFPNPSTGTISLRLPLTILSEANQLTIYTLEGRQVYTVELLKQEKQNLNLDLLAGMYILKIKSNDQLYNIQKLIISKD